MYLVTNIYKLTDQFPKEEQFGLTSQIRRSVISVPSNMAEGFGRDSNKEFYRFLTFSSGSLYEFQTQLEIAYNLEYISETEFNDSFELSRELERMLTSFMKKIKNTL